MAWNIKLLIGLLLFISAFKVEAYTYVSQLSHFRLHITLHKMRVMRIGMHLAQTHFPEVSLAEVRNFLELHDNSKMDEANAERLFRFYGKRPQNAEEERLLKAIVEHIDQVDDRIREEYLNARPLDPDTKEKLFIIEKVADLVDRGLDPVASEEFGHRLKVASEYMKARELAVLAAAMEADYYKIVQDLRMKPLYVLNSFNSCQRVFDF
ncbi:MAG: hypothetical protein AAGB31_13655 [Bdellovibrio sp.]